MLFNYPSIKYMNNNPIDILSLVHFIIFFVFGLFVKNKYIFAFLIGVIWEIIEYYVVNNNRQLLINYWPIPQKYWDETHKLNPPFDLLFNMSGYYLGNLF